MGDQQCDDGYVSLAARLSPIRAYRFCNRYQHHESTLRGTLYQRLGLRIVTYDYSRGHICWKVEREARMEPPIQTEYFLSGGAMILILMVEGARAVVSFCILSAIPGCIPM